MTVPSMRPVNRQCKLVLTGFLGYAFLDRLQQTCQTAEPLPHNLSQQANENQITGTNPDTDVLSRANMPSIHTLLEKVQATWAGHILCMNYQRILKVLLFGELAEGKFKVGRPNLRFKDSLKTTLKSLDIPVEAWEDLAFNRPSWRSQISSGAFSAEQRLRSTAKSKRTARKATAASSSTQSTSLPKCTICGREFRAQIGLISHLRNHPANQWSLSCRWTNIILEQGHTVILF